MPGLLPHLSAPCAPGVPAACPRAPGGDPVCCAWLWSASFVRRSAQRCGLGLVRLGPTAGRVCCGVAASRRVTSAPCAWGSWCWQQTVASVAFSFCGRVAVFRFIGVWIPLWGRTCGGVCLFLSPPRKRVWGTCGVFACLLSAGGVRSGAACGGWSAGRLGGLLPRVLT